MIVKTATASTDCKKVKLVQWRPSSPNSMGYQEDDQGV